MLQWVEAVYSCLGWTAKIAVFTAEWAYLNGEDLTHLEGALGWVLVVELILAANVALVCQQENVYASVNTSVNALTARFRAWVRRKKRWRRLGRHLTSWTPSSTWRFAHTG